MPVWTLDTPLGRVDGTAWNLGVVGKGRWGLGGGDGLLEPVLARGVVVQVVVLIASVHFSAPNLT